MARGRFITGTLGASHKLASVKDDGHRLMFVLMVTNADVEGRLDADPRVLNGRVFTLMGWSPEHVEAGLGALADAELISWYEIDGRPYAEIVNFHEHNAVRRDREQASRIEGPEKGAPLRAKRDAGGRQEGSGRAPAEVKSSQPKPKSKSSQELSSASPPRPDPYQPFVDAWNYHRGVLPKCQSLDDKRKGGLRRLLKDYGDQALPMFEEAVQHVAADPWWQQNGFGITNLLVSGRVLEKAEKFRADRGMSKGDRKLATTALEIQRAIGGGLDA